MNNLLLSPFFRLKEFESPDNHTVRISSVHFYRLNLLRSIVRKPFIVTSSYRTVYQNEKAGGRPGSLHLKGEATDILIKDFDWTSVANLAEDIGFKEIGLTGEGKALHLGG